MTEALEKKGRNPNNYSSFGPAPVPSVDIPDDHGDDDVHNPLLIRRNTSFLSTITNAFSPTRRHTTTNNNNSNGNNVYGVINTHEDDVSFPQSPILLQISTRPTITFAPLSSLPSSSSFPTSSKVTQYKTIQNTSSYSTYSYYYSHILTI